MPALLVPPGPSRAARPVAAPSPIRWTVDEFHDLFDDNRFEGRWVILIDGEIVEMPKPKPPHDTGITLTDYLLKGLFHGGHYVRCQCGLPLGLDTDPIPDVAVVIGSPRDHARRHPATAVLVVEVSDTTLAFDRGTKSHLYAAAGIPEYWVLDVTGGESIVFRDPRPAVAAPRGFEYGTVRTLTAADTVTPLAAPSAAIRVADLLP